MFLPLGLGGLSSVLASTLGPYRLYFTLLALALLGLGHFLMYKKARPTLLDRVVLWGTTAAVVVILVIF